MEQVRQQLDRASGPWEVSRAPADGQRLNANPPVFVWLPVEGVRGYVLQYSRDPAFRDDTTATVQPTLEWREASQEVPWSGLQQFAYAVPVATVRVLHEPLAPGTWYWRVGCDAGGDVVFSRACEFTIAPDAAAIPFPDIKEVVRRASAARPRMWVTPESLARVRATARGEMSEQLQRFLSRCDRYLGEPLLAEPEFLPAAGTAEWAPAYTRIFRATRPFIGGMAACAEAYLLSGDEKYGVEAKRRLLHVISWDPNGSTRLSHNDEVGTELVRIAPRVYDYIYDLLTPEERDRVRACLTIRMPQLYWALRVKPFEVNPFESHAMGYYLEDLTEACIAMAGEIDVAEWLEYCLTMLWSPFFPPYGGADGGWCEGPSYWGWTASVFVGTFRLVEQVAGVPIEQRDWMRNTGYYKLYGNPPYAKMSPFGDGQSNPPAGPESVWQLALAFNDPYLKWYAEQREFTPRGLDAFLLHEKDKALAGRPPADLPQARCFADVGLVAMHSDLAHGDRNVEVLMRSSPFGSISHAYADQNAFTLDAFGEPLAIASGYYPYYNSPHHAQWTWLTKASNSIGVDGEGQQIRDWNAKGRIAHFETSDYCHYALGDASAAYGGRLTKFDRHLLFLRPQAAEADSVVVIYDDVASPKPATFQWWLHALEKMEVDAAAQTVRIARGEAALDVLFLTPGQLAFSQTDQFTVPPEGDAARFPNQWHLTAETTAKAETCRFLTVLLPHRKGQEDPGRVVRTVTGDGYLGAEIVVRGTRHLVAFRTDPTRRDPIRIGDLTLREDVAAASWDPQGAPLGETSVALDHGR